MKAMIDRLYDWNFWGNRRTLQMIRDGGGGTPRMLELLSHILGAERIWLTRLEGEDSAGMEVFPSYSFDRCAELLEDNQRDWTSYLGALDEEKLLYKLNYNNQSGSEWETVVADILLHVSSHGHYHRGQINALARAEGWKPALTDLIIYTREMEAARN